MALSGKDEKSWYAGSGPFITWLDDNTSLDLILTVSVLPMDTGRLPTVCMYDEIMSYNIGSSNLSLYATFCYSLYI